MGEVLQAADSLRIAVLRFEDDGGPQRVNQAALAGNAEFRGKIAVNMGDDVHMMCSLLHS